MQLKARLRKARENDFPSHLLARMSMKTDVNKMLERREVKTKDRFTKIERLGSGSFGNVWLVRSNFSFKSYVVKEMSERCKNGKERESAINEANILAKLKHKNIIRYKDAYFDDDRLCIVMEYADDGKIPCSFDCFMIPSQHCRN